MVSTGVKFAEEKVENDGENGAVRALVKQRPAFFLVPGIWAEILTVTGQISFIVIALSNIAKLNIDFENLIPSYLRRAG